MLVVVLGRVETGVQMGVSVKKVYIWVWQYDKIACCWNKVDEACVVGDM